MAFNKSLKCLVGSLLGAGLIVFLFSSTFWHGVGAILIGAGNIIARIYDVGVLGLGDVLLAHKALSAFIILAVLFFLLCTSAHLPTSSKFSWPRLAMRIGQGMCLLLMVLFVGSFLVAKNQAQNFDLEFTTAQGWLNNVRANTDYDSFHARCENYKVSNDQMMSFDDYQRINDDWADATKDSKKPLVFYCENELTFYYAPSDRATHHPFSRDVFTAMYQADASPYLMANAFVLTNDFVSSLQPSSSCGWMGEDPCVTFGGVSVITNPQDKTWQAWERSHSMPSTSNKVLVGVVSIQSGIDFYGTTCRELVRESGGKLSKVLINGKTASESACQAKSNTLTYMEGIYQAPHVLATIAQKQASLDKAIDKKAIQVAKDLESAKSKSDEKK